MPPIDSDALVLRTDKLGETSKIVVLLTKERGKVRAVAKGVRGSRPRYHSALELMSEVRVGLYGRHGADLYRLGQCELLHSALLKESRDLAATLTLAYFAELFDGFSPEGEADDRTYRLALAALRALEEGVPSMNLARYVEGWLLRLHGLYPQIDRCVKCASMLPGGAIKYHHPAHGFLCRKCGEGTGPTLSSSARSFLARIFKESPATFQHPEPQPDVEGFHQELITRHLERDLKSYRVLRDALRGTAS